MKIILIRELKQWFLTVQIRMAEPITFSRLSQLWLQNPGKDPLSNNYLPKPSDIYRWYMKIDLNIQGKDNENKH